MATVNAPSSTECADGPLTGYRILDFGWVYAGPVMSTVLADMGAEVIKVETRTNLDVARLGRPIFGDNVDAGDAGEDPDRIPLFHALNRNKLSLSLNLRHPRGPELVRRMVANCDVVAENFTPRVLPKYGLDYESLRKLKEDLVMISITAAGQTGPIRDLASYAPSISSYGGLESMAGYAGERVIGMMGLNFGDPMVGLWGAFAVMAALHQRNRTGRGQYIDISQLEATVCLVGEALLEYQMTGNVPGPHGNRSPSMAPHGNYPCAGEDEWISIAVATDEEWRALCAVTGHQEWAARPEFADHAARVGNRVALDEAIASWTREQTGESAMAQLQEAGVAAMPLFSVVEQFSDPHYQARAAYVDVEHPLVGTEIVPGVPWKLSETPGRVRRPAPNLGEHTDDILSDLLELGSDEIDELRTEGVLE